MREYKIGYYKFGFIHREKSINFIEYKTLNSHEKKLQRLISVINLLKAMRYNYQDYHENLSFLSQKYYRQTNVIPTDIDESKLQINKSMLNILSMFRTNLDHLDSFHSNYFGSNSIEREYFKKLLSSIFDSSWVYRFMYKLRNYSQHRGVPIDYFTVSFEETEKSIEKLEGLIIQFDRDNLLRNYDSWSNHVINGQKEKEERFDVNPILDEFMSEFEQIESYVIDMIKNELKSTRNMISRIVSIQILKSEDLFIYWNEKNSMLIVNSSLRYYKSLLSFCSSFN